MTTKILEIFVQYVAPFKANNLYWQQSGSYGMIPENDFIIMRF